MNNSIQIIQPDDWHVHFREGQMLKEITKYSSRVNKRCIAMPNTNIPITKAEQAVIYSKIIKENSFNADFFSNGAFFIIEIPYLFNNSNHFNKYLSSFIIAS